ncbi:MAG TPA: FHA domain-containing protein, partial [Myxococcota bacterium]|nr:FHA domain-containing protein [Myxococcota bacterium]
DKRPAGLRTARSNPTGLAGTPCRGQGPRHVREAGRIAARCAKAGRPFVQRAGRALLLGDFERARGAAETALAIDPASDDAKAVLARAQQALVDLGDKGAPASARLLDGRHMRAPAHWTRVRLKWDEIRHSGPLAFRRPVLPASACRLRIARASGATRQLDLAARSYRLGRAPENEIVLEDGSQTVSPFHAELRPGPSGYVLHDCASDHGVWVDGRRVNRVRLEPDVPVAIGPYRLVLEDASDQSPVAAAQA